MEYRKFIESTVIEQDMSLVKEMMGKIIGEYISFEVIKEADITRDIFAEKMCDFFEKLELKTARSFEKQIQRFIFDLDTVVSRGIPKEEKAKGQAEPIVYRTTKYYEKALKIKSQRQLTLKALLDYFRVMMCLYSAEIKSSEKEIKDFDFSMESICLEDIIDALKNEPAPGPAVLAGKKPRFDTKELYCSDTCTFILVIMMYFYMKRYDMLGE